MRLLFVGDVIGKPGRRVLRRLLDGLTFQATPASFDVAKRDVRLAAAVVDVDETTGKAPGVERLLLPDPG